MIWKRKLPEISWEEGWVGWTERNEKKKTIKLKWGIQVCRWWNSCCWTLRSSMMHLTRQVPLFLSLLPPFMVVSFASPFTSFSFVLRISPTQSLLLFTKFDCLPCRPFLSSELSSRAANVVFEKCSYIYSKQQTTGGCVLTSHLELQSSSPCSSVVFSLTVNKENLWFKTIHVSASSALLSADRQ